MRFNELDNIEERIINLIRESRDPDFTNYLLTVQKKVLDQKQYTVKMMHELDLNEEKYRKNMEWRSRQMQMPSPVPQPVVPETVEVSEGAVTSESIAEPIAEPVIVEKVEAVAIPTPARATVEPAQSKKKINAEFAIGATVLSIVGSVFVLAALVMLGLYFTSGLVKGLFLYGGCLAVMLLAELLVYRKFPNLGLTLSAIGMGGLYISTLVNYLVLKNFNQWVALGVMLAITLGVIILSRKRDAAAYRILGLAAMYISVYMVLNRSASLGGLSQIEFVAITVFALVVNVMCLFVPVNKGHTAIQITHMALNTVFAIVVTAHWHAWATVTVDSVAEMALGPMLAATSILAMQLIFITQIRWAAKRKAEGVVTDNSGICVTYCISGLIYMGIVAVVCNFNGMLGGADDLVYVPHRLVSAAIVVLLCSIPLFALGRHQEKWFSWYLLNLLVLSVISWAVTDIEIYVYLLVLLLASKALSFTKQAMLKISDAGITSLVCIVVLAEWKEPWVFLLVIGLLISVVCINYWNTYFEMILMFTLAYFSSWHMLPLLKLPVFVGIMFLGMFIFNNVPKWHGKGIQLLNWAALAAQTVCYLMLINPVYRNSYLTYLCMLIFGVTTIVVCFQETYHLDLKCKPLIMAGFLTYMGLVVRTGYPIINSILLMVIALGCVAVGFAIQKKTLRVYGLMLSLAVCVKLVVYDFAGNTMLQRTILFFAVGVLALIIAAIYMVLERKNEKQQQEVNKA